MLVAGPVTVLRILRYGDTTIDDFSHYPGRALQASESPAPFSSVKEPLHIGPITLRDDESEQALEQILESNDSIAFLIIRDATILYERYFQGHIPSSLSQTFSMSKSFTSALIGMAIDDGYIESVDQPVTNFIPELAGKGFEDVTIHHLLTMMSGSSYVENDNPFGEHVILNYTPNLESRILGFDMADEPGELFRYKSGDNALLALALDRALGSETLTQYAQRRLWTPLGMEDDGVWTIDREGDGLEKTWCCLAATARDFAKLGQLYLNAGAWKERQILSPEWIAASTQAQVPEAAWPQEFQDIGWRNYGYQWWLASKAEGDYFALGKDGQFLYINSSRDVLVLRLGWSAGDLRSSQWIALFQQVAAQVSDPEN